MKTQALVTNRSSSHLYDDEEDGEVWTYTTQYRYTAVESTNGGNLVFYGTSLNRDTYLNANKGWLEVIYSKRNPKISLPSGEYASGGSTASDELNNWPVYMVGFGLLLAGVYFIWRDLKKLWRAIRSE